MDTILKKSISPIYTGKVQPKPGEVDSQGQRLSSYLPEEGLVEAVNLAIYLQRPLLLRGEPGCGKTRLAEAVRYELKLAYEPWHIKSTSRARDGLYTYNTIGQLRDAQLAAAGRLDEQGMQRLEHPVKYIQWGPLGHAFQNDRQTVILIDEIDKADIDFPNDLLLELEEKRFFVEETKTWVRAKQPPIVFITSNDEKELPDAFLRRCLFYYIKFPDRQRLKEILFAHFPDAQERIVEAVVTRFTDLRTDMYKDKSDTGKKISTSELIDWFRILQLYPKDEIHTKLEDKNLPFASVLLKSRDDQDRYQARR